MRRSCRRRALVVPDRRRRADRRAAHRRGIHRGAPLRAQPERDVVDAGVSAGRHAGARSERRRETALGIVGRAHILAAMNTAGAMAQALAEAGIKKAFGLPGGEVLVLIDELRKAGIDFVLMRHEANAGIAAAVYGKLNRPARRRDRHARPRRRQPAAAGRERLSRSGAAARDHRADSRRLSRPAIRINCCRCTTPSGRCARWSRRSRRRTPATRFGQALDGVHGSPVRRVVPDAVGAGSGQAAADGRRASRRTGTTTTPSMANPTRRARLICARDCARPSARWCWSA